MACGCLVFSYNVALLTEYLPSDFLFEQGDIIGIAKSIERITQFFGDEIEKWEPLSKTSRDIAIQYSVEREEKSVITAWRKSSKRAIPAWSIMLWNLKNNLITRYDFLPTFTQFIC